MRKDVNIMEMTINADGLIHFAAVLAALGGIGGVVVWCIKGRG